MENLRNEDYCCIGENVKAGFKIYGGPEISSAEALRIFCDLTPTYVDETGDNEEER